MILSAGLAVVSWHLNSNGMHNSVCKCGSTRRYTLIMFPVLPTSNKGYRPIHVLWDRNASARVVLSLVRTWMLCTAVRRFAKQLRSNWKTAQNCALFQNDRNYADHILPDGRLAGVGSFARWFKAPQEILHPRKQEPCCREETARSRVNFDM